MDIRFTKGPQADIIAIVRDNGTTADFTFPKKGPVPHDVFHVIVESELGLARGFWGMIADGADPQAVGAIAAAGGHASAKRAGTPDPAIVELIQAERLVECFEAESWSQGADNDGIRLMAAAGWNASKVPPLELPDAALGRIRKRIAAFSQGWQVLTTGGTMALPWSLR